MITTSTPPTTNGSEDAGSSGDCCALRVKPPYVAVLSDAIVSPETGGIATERVAVAGFKPVVSHLIMKVPDWPLASVSFMLATVLSAHLMFITNFSSTVPLFVT